MNSILIAAIAVGCLTIGFAAGQAATKTPAAPKRVTGIGGVFFKGKDPAALKAWYGQHLGLPINQWGTTFEWREADDPERKAKTEWAIFSEKSKYFAPSEKGFMINYRVANMTALLEELKKEGIEPVDAVQRESYGSFVHIMDPEGNKIELWDPEDVKKEKGESGNAK